MFFFHVLASYESLNYGEWKNVVRGNVISHNYESFVIEKVQKKSQQEIAPL